MLPNSKFRNVLLAMTLLFLAIGCSNPGEYISLDGIPADAVETISGDGFLDGFLDAVPEIEDDTACVPNCASKECGDDGCGGTACGKCADELICSPDFKCVPDCDTLCQELDCGDAGTGGACDCGTCPAGYGCTNEGLCTAACADLCDGLDCGPAGEEGECDCGTCQDFYACTEGACVVDCEAACATAECTPEWATDLCDCGACDDGNPCTTDVCIFDGTCEFMGLNAVECDDGDPCTEAAMCQAGVCVGTPVFCDDENICTDDSCDPDNGECVFEPNTADCDDEDVCTIGDVCADGVCAGLPVNCECESDADCDKLEDGDLCNGTLYCDTTLVQQLCKVDPSTVVDCPEPGLDDPDAPCLQPSCDPDTGECGFEEDNEGFPCVDEDLCTVADYCEKGECVAGVDANCNDANLCTDDTCDPLTGCLQTPNEDPCEDGNPCTIGDMCQDGECAHGAPLVCNDGDVCTDDLCDPEVLGGCVFVPNQAECDDGNICTLNDACAQGICLGEVALDCDDFNPCTDDSCDPLSGCIHIPNTSICDDEDPCTTLDVCDAGFCVGSGALDCDDANPCTADLCEPGAGCVFLPTFGVCDDENPCTANDICMEGICQGGSLTVCDDGNHCTTDSCDPDLGCVFTPNSLGCDDGDACTIMDTCQNGLCQSTQTLVCKDSNPCTADLCDPQTGCQFLNVEGQCDDGNPCTVSDTCQDGICVPGGYDPCDDGNPCSTDSCTPATGCVHTANALPCDDGNPCTFPDRCGQGICTGILVSCDDGNPCTNDWCEPAMGCNHGFNTAACDDQSDCTTDDHCSNGLCEGTGDTDCDDGNPCTKDICLVGGGCDWQPLSETPCSDDDPCTVDDLCAAGVCVPGDDMDCNDDDPCTEDSCMGGLCESSPNPDGDCTDGDACTTGDHCNEDGVCVGGEAMVCDDQNPCTNDWCDPVDGCQSANNTLACTDGDPCTIGDLCADSVCVSGAAMACDDGNPCTDDSCGEGGGCDHTPNDAACFDGNLCTTLDQCNDGLCAGSMDLDCDDDNPCTEDSCDPQSGCIHTNLEGPCTDGDPCTTGDVCVFGQCTPGPMLDCVDGNPCTDDSCANGKCLFVPNEAPCDDGNACTSGDHCGGAQCIYTELLDCDDDNPCTLNTCDPATGCTVGLADAACSDGDECTHGDQCVNGQCLSVGPVECDDGNPCTDDWCDSLTGCVFTPNAEPCDDGDLCTPVDHCAEGVCTGEATTCDDDNPCTTDWCDPLSGCMNQDNDATCDDANPCTDNDTCMAGICAGVQTSCDDGNPCTDDTCDPQGGCLSTHNTAACDDQNDCTTDDVCSNGVCQGVGDLSCDDGNPCTKDICLAEGGCDHDLLSDIPCSDGDPCTVSDGCVEGQCVPGESKDCDDSNPCTTDSCDGELGWCTNVPADGPCDDGNACTDGDACVEGECLPLGLLDCDDDNPCTQDSCHPDEGCLHAQLQGPCDDGDACTLDDVCVDGLCLGAGAPACDDGNPCTNDTCDPQTGCVHQANDHACTDGNACTDGDQCAQGECAPGGVLNCDDDNACTGDSCDPTQGCIHVDINVPCSDFNACTVGDKCLGGVCTPSGSLSCDDGNPCTDDTCDPNNGCLNAPNQLECSDGSVCTMGDLCMEGQCVPGIAMDCDDDNPCTNDSCDPETGCLHVANFAACTDNNACTLGDACVEGLCQTTGVMDCGDGNPCTDDSCDPDVGCTNLPNQKPCTDGNQCTVGDHCQEGTCVYEGLSDCDDDNPCTTDSCDPNQGCLNAPNTDPCDDGSACTAGDKCGDGQCLSGEEITCNDENVCTDDSCDPAMGCVFTPNQAPCNDQNECTINDVCGDGECHGQGSLECNDENPCTKDICLPEGGCDHELLTGSLCSDNNPCTLGDACQEGQCQPGQPVVCDDDNDCTDDLCVDGQCKFSANSAACDDENACTLGDHCENKQCLPMGLMDCEDENVCTTDSCDPAEGCVHQPNQNLCDDNNACTDGDHCAGGQCVPTGMIVCNDGNPCTDDSCDAEGGCDFQPNDDLCTDNNKCTNVDQCMDGQCVPGPALECDDEISCTIDTCLPAVGCGHQTVDALCGDENPCTMDSCDPAEGCLNVNQPVDCALGPWGPWSPCDEVCGGGERTRTRAIVTPASCDGALCGPTQETEACNTDPCAVDCEWHWSEWGECEDGCPYGTQTRTVVVDQEPMYGGQACPTASQSQSCSMVGTDCTDGDACTLSDVCTPDGCVGVDATTVPNNGGGCDDGDDCTLDGCQDIQGQLLCTNLNQPVDCVVDAWTPWPDCTPTLSGGCYGTTTRTRAVLTPAQCDGDPCPALLETEDCDLPAGENCEDGFTCTAFEVCDGQGKCGGAVPVDSVCADTDPCTADVCEPAAETADEDGCTHTNVPVDCVLGPWGPWGQCSAECGGGTQGRTREILTPASCGGQACGPLEDSQDCNTEPCCEPYTCEDLDADCGTHDDGCGGDLVCGVCDDEDPCTTDTCVQKTAIEGNFLVVPEYGAYVGCMEQQAFATRVTLTQATTVTSLWAEMGMGQQVQAILMDSLDPMTPGSVLACSDTIESADGEVEFPIDPVDLIPGDYWIIILGDYADLSIGSGVDLYSATMSFNSMGGCFTLCSSGTWSGLQPMIGEGARVWMSTLPGGWECSSTNVPVDCDGSWSTWSTCASEGLSCTGSQSRTFTVTQAPECAGAECPDSPQVQQCSMPQGSPCEGDGVDCTEDDVCDGAGTCEGIPNDALCDDQDPCTDDTCTLGDSVGYEDLQEYSAVEGWTDFMDGECHYEGGIFGAAIVLTETTTITGLGTWYDYYYPAEGADLILFSLYDGTLQGPETLLACAESGEQEALPGAVVAPLEAPLTLEAGTYWLLTTAVGSFQVGLGLSPGATHALFTPYESLCSCMDPLSLGPPMIGAYGPDTQLLAWLETTPGCVHTPSDPVDCQGTWSDWSDCVPGEDPCTGTRSRTLNVTQPAECGGTCVEIETEECQMPVDQGGCNDGDDCTQDSCAEGSEEAVWGYDEAFPGGAGQGMDGFCMMNRHPGGMITVGEDTTVETIGAWIEHSSGMVRLGIYSGGPGGPTGLLVCSGLVDAPDGGLLETPIPSTLLSAGTYWIIVIVDEGASLLSNTSIQDGVSGYISVVGGYTGCAQDGCVEAWSNYYPETGRAANVYVKGSYSAVNCTYEDICEGVPVINEVDYDQPGGDTMEFLEIYNPTESGVDLSELTLELINGNGGWLYGTFPLDQGLSTNLLAAGEFLVVGSDDLLATVSQDVLQISLGSQSIQNGAPDGARIVTSEGGILIDGIAYEGTMPGTGEGTTAPTDNDTSSLNRCPDGADTNDNGADFILVDPPTPGAANTCVADCDPGEYADGMDCLPCPEGCVTCSSAVECEACVPTYTLVGLLCVPTECVESSEPQSPGFSDCVAAVCELDPFCCDTAWDSICVGEVDEYCVSPVCD